MYLPSSGNHTDTRLALLSANYSKYATRQKLRRRNTFTNRLTLKFLVQIIYKGLFW